MDTVSLIIFLLVAIASYIQTPAGFALGLVFTGTVTLLNLAPETMVTIVISLPALVNSFPALVQEGLTVNWSSMRLALLVPVDLLRAN